MYFSIFRFTNFESTSFGWQEGAVLDGFSLPFSDLFLDFWEFFWIFIPIWNYYPCRKLKLVFFGRKKTEFPLFIPQGRFLTPEFGD
jgi:hypothetical protein